MRTSCDDVEYIYILFFSRQGVPNIGVKWSHDWNDLVQPLTPDVPRKLRTPCIKKVLLSLPSLVAREESYPGTCIYAHRERATAAMVQEAPCRK